ncbi:hypothetical protein GCM10010218_46440 [Streptomyces mashuensis]|uniref:Secreted protein n=1 Tax=Streptomyces mashuensis TaxID=33904 RepID=A0A919B6J7_9ACTN|nr:hypothetical protein [Streptomyces mashuensis]GHF59597.1 hypothetical protein GCM10010218_46440 [Streptomyces mashuensis]
MKNSLTRVAASSLLLATGGLALAAGTAQAEGAAAPAAQQPAQQPAERPGGALTDRVTGLASARSLPVDELGRTAAYVRDEIPHEARGEFSVRAPLAEELTAPDTAPDAAPDTE